MHLHMPHRLFYCLKEDHARLSLWANVFANRVGQDWNNLPNDVISAPSVYAFNTGQGIPLNSVQNATIKAKAENSPGCVPLCAAPCTPIRQWLNISHHITDFFFFLYGNR